MEFKVTKEFVVSLSEKEAVELWMWMDNNTRPTDYNAPYTLWAKLNTEFKGKVLS